MVTTLEVVEQAGIAASDALDRLVGFLIASGCSDDVAIDASRLLIDSRPDEPSKATDRATWERACANDLLLGAWAVMQVAEPDDGDEHEDEIDPQVGYQLLRKGDRAGALDSADAMLRQAGVPGSENWNYGNLVHHGHILRGTIFLQDSDIPAAVSELLAAAATPEALRIFGEPDLSLAVSLLRAGQDDAVLTYLRATAESWSPDLR